MPNDSLPGCRSTSGRPGQTSFRLNAGPKPSHISQIHSTRAGSFSELEAARSALAARTRAAAADWARVLHLFDAGERDAVLGTGSSSEWHFAAL